MRLMRRAARVDDNQKDIVRALRAHGCSVESLAAVGRGVPDLLVGHAERNLLLEVKRPGGRLTKDQVRWHGAWGGSVVVVYCIEDALMALGVGNAD